MQRWKKKHAFNFYFFLEIYDWRDKKSFILDWQVVMDKYRNILYA